MRKLLICLLAICAKGTLFAQTFFTSGGINYKFETPTTVEVGLNSGFVGDANIPSNVIYEGVVYPVTSIGVAAFNGCINLKSVLIPNSVTKIGNSAFNGCISLKNINNIPVSVTKIGGGAFANCTSLTSLTLSKGIKSVDDFAFKNCTALRSVIMQIGVEFIGDEVFMGCTSLNDVIMPESLVWIGNGAFRQCSYLTEITLPQSIVWINNHTFYDCKMLKSVIIPNTLTHILESSFALCKQLQTINMPARLSVIGSSAFAGCISLTSLNIPDNALDIGSSAFSGCTGLTSIKLPNLLNQIKENTFNGCSNLTSIELPNFTTFIYDGAFSNCSKLASVNISNSVSRIGFNVFKNCTNLKSVNVNWPIPLSINSNVFENVSIANATLSVPSGTQLLYKNVLVWKNFGKIISNTIPKPSITAKGQTTFATGGSVLFTANPSTGFSYQWLNNGSNIANANSATYTATATGIYTLKITANNVSETSNAIVVNVIYILPANNFKITNTSETCRSSNNGKIGIEALQANTYTAQLTGNGLNLTKPFTNAVDFLDLQAGRYKVCITVSGQTNYSQCFDVTIVQPQDLAVYSVIKADNKVTLTLNGSDLYNVELNGNTQQTSLSSLELNLQPGQNVLKVSTGKNCQGVIEKQFTVNPKPIIYPNPFERTLNLYNIPKGTIAVEVQNLDGKVVFKSSYVNKTGSMSIEFNQLNAGNYILKTSINNSVSIFKIIKK